MSLRTGFHVAATQVKNEKFAGPAIAGQGCHLIRCHVEVLSCGFKLFMKIGGLANQNIHVAVKIPELFGQLRLQESIG